MKTILITMIQFYKAMLSPLLPSSCRFYPSCSDYCAEAIEKHGAFTGLLMSLKRVLRCHPISRGGYDPVK
ncbi:MAG: membrane protein insertion efficiency factor YidD [Nitrospirae bacterium]|nr:membrane protein insertion efficiency factor YidD [Nitrospirota bacterium]